MAALPPSVDTPLAAAAAAHSGPPDASTGDKEASRAEPGWAFPVFVGRRRRLPPDDPLFEAGNMEREQLARQAAVAVARDERRQLAREAELAADASLPDRLLASFKCGRCRASLPTARLLQIHVAELHDSFFAAQAARRMPVYVCLVEGCPRKFCTVEERKQHLQDHHKFPRHFHFDRLHLRRRTAQIRPLPQFQKGHGRQAMAEDAGGGGGGGGDPAEAQQQQAGQAMAEAGEEGACSLDPGSPRTAVLQGMSRLRLAAESSAVPQVIHFGRGRGRGLPGRGGRGGGGRQKARRAQAGAAPGPPPSDSQ